MMLRLQQGEGTIGLYVDERAYVETDANFKRDTGSDSPPLPEGIERRLYEPDIRHALSGSHGVINGGPMPWPEGDTILANFDQIIAAQKRRLSGFKQRFDMGGDIHTIIGT